MKQELPEYGALRGAGAAGLEITRTVADAAGDAGARTAVDVARGAGTAKGEIARTVLSAAEVEGARTGAAQGESTHAAATARPGSLARRIAVYLVGVVVLCLGVVLNTRTGLGTAAMSTIPYSMQIIEGVSLGTASFAIYCIFVVLQLAMVRYFDVKILLQIPVSLLFGVLTDVFDIWVLPFYATSFAASLAMLSCAILLTGLGVTLVVSARLVPVATDGMVQTLAEKLGWEFGKAKYLFDGTCACITIVYSLVRVGHVVGIGLGTVAAVLCTGGVCTMWGRLLKGPLARFMYGARSR